MVLLGFFMLASAFLGPAAKNAEAFYVAISKQIIIGLVGGGTALFYRQPHSLPILAENFRAAFFGDVFPYDSGIRASYRI